MNTRRKRRNNKKKSNYIYIKPNEKLVIKNNCNACTHYEDTPVVLHKGDIVYSNNHYNINPELFNNITVRFNAEKLSEYDFFELGEDEIDIEGEVRLYVDARNIQFPKQTNQEDLLFLKSRKK